MSPQYFILESLSFYFSVFNGGHVDLKTFFQGLHLLHHQSSPAASKIHLKLFTGWQETHYPHLAQTLRTKTTTKLELIICKIIIKVCFT